MDFLGLVSEVGFPIAGAVASGIFVFTTLKFITFLKHFLILCIKVYPNLVQNA